MPFGRLVFIPKPLLVQGSGFGAPRPASGECRPPRPSSGSGRGDGQPPTKKVLGQVLEFVLTLLVWMNAAGAATPTWERVTTGVAETTFVAIATDSQHPERLFAASERAVYASTDHGNQWDRRFQLPAQTIASALAVDMADVPALLLATDQGVYASFDGGQHWDAAFRGTAEGARACAYVAFHPAQADVALLATAAGLFISHDRGRNWQDAGLPSSARPVVHFTVDPQDPDRLYVVTPQRLFIGSLTKGQWTERFAMFHAEELAVEESDTIEADGEPDLLHHLSGVAVDPQTPSTVYLATSRGLQRSRDGGTTWERVTGAGLTSRAIARVLPRRQSPLVIYAATDHGIARYDPQQDRWEMITDAVAMTRVHDLAASPTQLWAATDQGLFRLQVAPDTFERSDPPSAQDLLGNFVTEPSVGQVRDAAIRYADVHPNKIARWRRQAALQALLPNVNVGLDRGRSFDTHVDEGAFPNFQFIRSQNHDTGADVSITWDLGELIWNDDQTSIDVRSKLMVQLRDDILDEVTRTYFERRRLQIALLSQPPADQKQVLEKELRLQELTAMIDGLTGGYFSTHLGTHENR